MIAHQPDHSLYCVIGFYTPDYESLTRRLGDRLMDFDIPHEFIPYPAMDWNEAIYKKPEVVLHFMDHYPHRYHILMDVDCNVEGPLDVLVELMGDADLMTAWRIKGKKTRAFEKGDYVISSRIMVWAPTKVAYGLAAGWLHQAGRPEQSNDEIALTKMITKFDRAAVPLKLIEPPIGYRALELTAATRHHVITHSSEHDRRRPLTVARRRLKRLKRQLIEPFLGGKTYEEWKYGRLKEGPDYGDDSGEA